MPNISWTALNVPQRPQRSSWSREGQAARWTFEADSGLTYARPSGRRGDKLSVTFIMTRAQAITFENWFHNTLREGTLCFTFADPDTNSNLTVRFDPSASSAYTVTAIGLNRSVSMKWEVMP